MIWFWSSKIWGIFRSVGRPSPLTIERIELGDRVSHYLQKGA